MDTLENTPVKDSNTIEPIDEKAPTQPTADLEKGKADGKVQSVQM
jgi:hypothetical protein